MEMTFSLPQELHVAVEAIARRTGRDRRAVLVDAVRDYVSRQEQPRLRSIGVIEETPVQSDDVEAWLATHRPPEEDRHLTPDGDEAASPVEPARVQTRRSTDEQPRPPRRLHVLEFDAGEVGLEAKDIDAYLEANWRPDDEWRDTPER